MRSGIRILASYQIRTVGRKSGDFRRSALLRHVSRIKDGKWRPAHGGYDSVQLPRAQHLLIPTLRMLPEWKAPLIAENKPVASVEQRTAPLGGQIERILCQIILAGNGFGGRAGHVEGRRIVNRLRERIRTKE